MLFLDGDVCERLSVTKSSLEITFKNSHLHFYKKLKENPLNSKLTEVSGTVLLFSVFICKPQKLNTAPPHYIKLKVERSLVRYFKIRANRIKTSCIN